MSDKKESDDEWTQVSPKRHQRRHRECGAGDDNQLSHNIERQLTIDQKSENIIKKSHFVRRPGVGSKGRSIELVSNHFRLKVEDICCYHYDVDILLNKTNGWHSMLANTSGAGDGKNFKKLAQNVNRCVIQNLVNVWRQLFTDIKPVYDGTRNLYTSRPLQMLGFNKNNVLTKTIEVDFENNCQSYNVQIKFARKVELSAVNDYYSGKLSEFPKEALQALDIILRHGPTINRIPIGNSLYTPWAPKQRTSIGDNREVAFGHYQSVRYTSSGPTLVIDRTATAFHTGGSILDFVINLIDLNSSQRKGFNSRPLRPTKEQMVSYYLNDNDFEIINKELKGLQVFSEHLKYKRKYKVLSISQRSANEEMFDWECNNKVRESSVAQYFAKQYNIELKYPHLPCLNVGTAKKATYLPLELCQLVPDQHVRKKITSLQTANMIKLSASQNPLQRFEVIERSAKDVINDSRQQLLEFKIELNDKPIAVNGRVIDAPTLQFKRSNNFEIIKVEDGKWELKNKGLFHSIELSDWCLVVMAYQMFQNANLKDTAFQTINKFVSDLINEGKKIGMSVEKPKELVPKLYTQNSVESVITYLRKKCPKLQLVMFISNENDQLYNEIKYTGDVKLGITTQCIHQKNVWKYNSSLMINFLLKVNAKMGGINAKINEQIFGDKPEFLKSSTMIIAADVTHPAPADQLTASVAAVVASYDNNYCYYSTAVRVQQNANGEMIMDFKVMLFDLLCEYRRRNNDQLPQKIIFYRDGVSEGQFDSVLDHEHKKMLEAFQDLGPDYKPKVTFVVVQKRHHTRFRVKNKFNGVGRAFNIPPGTTVDQIVTHPTDFDFYLCSHEGSQGTSRPTHYVVLHDDNHFSADQLQRVTFFLCHIYARCARSISIPAPVMYAHLAAFRSRHHIIARRHDSKDSKNLKSLNSDIKVNHNCQSTLYYC